MEHCLAGNNCCLHRFTLVMALNPYNLARSVFPFHRWGSRSPDRALPPGGGTGVKPVLSGSTAHVLYCRHATSPKNFLFFFFFGVTLLLFPK